MCDLCKAVESNNYTCYGNFIYIPKCHTCGDSILVSIFHKPELDESAQKDFNNIVKNSFSCYKPRGIGMRSSGKEGQHWHEHLILKESN